MPASVTDSDDEPIDESREPKTWDEVEDTINDEEDDDAEVFLSTLGSEADQKPVIHHEEIPKGRFVDPLGILRMPPRTVKPQSIDDEHFNPVVELSGLHMSTQFGDLVQGMRRLARKLSSHEADIKQLVRDNFDRFISCKDVIDGLYELISENEMSAQGTGTGKVEATVREVLARANRVYSPLLARKAETDKIRQSLSVLSRFSFLFTLPSKIAANIRDGEYDKAVQHYKKATSIFQDQAAISHISVFLHVFTEVENIVADFRSTLYSALADPNSSFEAQERVIRILVDLARPSDFRINPSISANNPNDDPGWYYLNMAASRMVARLSGSESTTNPSTPAAGTAPSTAPTTPSAEPPPLILITSGEVSRPPAALTMAATGGVYRSVRSACGHVARHLPNLWKMGRYYLEGRFDPRNYGSASDKGKEELQAHPHREDKDKVDKTATVRVFFSDETSSVRVDSRKTCGEIIDICLRRVEGDHSPNNYAIFTWIEKRKKDGTKVIKITELGVGEKIHKLHKKWGDKSGHSHKFLFKRKDETFPKTHDPRTIVEDYTLEMRSANDTRKNKEEGGGGKTSGGRKGEGDFIRLITSVMSVFAERVEALFFLENGDDDFDADLADSNGDQAEEWAFGKMRSQVLDVVTTLNILQRAGMTEYYLEAVNQLVLKLCGHYVTRVCGQWSAEVALLYLSVPRSNRSTTLDASSGMPITSTSLDPSTSSITDLPSIFVATTKFYLAQFKGIVAKGHPLMTQILSAFGEALKCFADTLHHLAFHHVYDDDDEEEKGDKTKMHHQLRIVGYIVYTRNAVVGSLWSHFMELFKMSSTHADEEGLASPLEVFRQLGDMAAARYIHDKLTIFNKLLRDGILLNPTTEWTTSTPPTSVSEYAMSILLQFVYIFAELSILDSSSDNYREQRFSSGKLEKDDLLGGPPFLVINKLIGEMLWGMMEGMQRCIEQLDSGTISACGVCQLQLDFTFIETVLSKYNTDKSSGVAQHIHALLKQMEEEAYQVGAGEDHVDVEIEDIIDDTSRRSALLFASLTGSADFAAPIPKSSSAKTKVAGGGLAVPTTKRKDATDRKSALSADLKFGKDSHKLMELQQARVHQREMEKLHQERQQEKQQEKQQQQQQQQQQDNKFQMARSASKDFERDSSKSRLEMLARRGGGGEKKDEKESDLRSSSSSSLSIASNREQERERIREREREKRMEKEREREREQKEKEEKEQQKQRASMSTLAVPTIEVRSPDGAATTISSSREREREKQRERQQAKLLKR